MVRQSRLMKCWCILLDFLILLGFILYFHSYFHLHLLLNLFVHLTRVANIFYVIHTISVRNKMKEWFAFLLYISMFIFCDSLVHDCRKWFWYGSHVSFLTSDNFMNISLRIEQMDVVCENPDLKTPKKCATSLQNSLGFPKFLWSQKYFCTLW